jgi:flagellar basal body-associated protein FliL
MVWSAVTFDSLRREGKMKTKLWALLLVLTSLVLLAGCGQTTSEAPTTASPEEAATAPAAPEATEAPQAPAAGGPVKITIFVGFGTGTEP